MAYRKTETVIAQLAARREAIIDAAVDLVERGGREALTSARLAEAAEVSEGGLYKHFPDMGEVWAAVVARTLQADLAAMQAASGLSPGVTLHGALIALYKRFTRRRLREALFADQNYRAGLHRAFRPIIAACLPEDDSRVAMLGAAVPGALIGVYQVHGQASGAAEKAAVFVVRGLGLPSRVTAAVAAGRQS
jgi:AcrR family transcriptional regulator